MTFTGIKFDNHEINYIFIENKSDKTAIHYWQVYFIPNLVTIKNKHDGQFKSASLNTKAQASEALVRAEATNIVIINIDHSY
jgi:hypothetical protein